MTTSHLLAEELYPLIEGFPNHDLDADNLAAFRAFGEAAAVLADTAGSGVCREDIRIPGPDGEVRCLLYRPEEPCSGRPAYLHIHGGGYIMGSPEGSDAANLLTCARLGTVVLSVDYRLAPEHPIPAPLDDCYAGLAWLHDNAATLSIDPSRIAVGGESAGGGLAAAVAIRARDEGRYGICHQHLTYPMLDDRTGTDAHPGDPLTGEFVWTRQRNRFGWQAYLGDAPAAAPQVPARVDDVGGLPRTWLLTAGLDLFRDENIHFAQRLMAAGVSVELAVYANACHGFQMLPGTELQARFTADHLAGLARGLRVAL